MAKSYRHSGQTRNITPTAAVTSGEVVASGAMAGIAIADIAANEMGVIKLAGVYRVSAPAHGLAQGDAVTMTLATQVVEGGGTAIGFVDEVVNADSIDVLLNGLPASS